ncbi:class I tRNA ligase family protein [Clavibacter tessellarius]|uniref:class I tRNA ligase family protein n=1 Tax=Clavibacter tessellarius TaxID=31965 RepID=UPI00324DD76F
MRPTDLHRPFIDRLTRPNPDDPTGRSTMRRIEDVLDVWFDSGSMPFAQVHYPFENREWFDEHSPADFIVEYIGQTRGWFYTLHALSTALFERPAFSSVVSHGIVLGNDGQKMSKSLRNYPDVNEVFDRDGSDAMRWFLLASPVLRGGNLVVTEEGIREGVRQVLLPLWSTWYFFSLYANSAQPGGYEATRDTTSDDVLDRYVLARTRRLVAEVTEHMTALDSTLAAAALRDFADVLTNWYVRRSRDRFWAGTATGDTRAFDTLYTVLETVTRVAAPLLPLVSERIWKDLTGGRSVHLEDWPEPDDLPADDRLVEVMDRVRQVASTALSLRKQSGLRVRQPLARLTVVSDDAEGSPASRTSCATRLNVKAVSVEEPHPHERLRRGHHAPPHRQRAGRGSPPRQGRAAGDPGGPLGRLDRSPRRGRRGRRAARGRRVRAGAGGGGRPGRPGARAPAGRRLPAARHRAHPRGSRPRASRATWCGTCRTRGRARGST